MYSLFNHIQKYLSLTVAQKEVVWQLSLLGHRLPGKNDCLEQ